MSITIRQPVSQRVIQPWFGKSLKRVEQHFGIKDLIYGEVSDVEAALTLFDELEKSRWLARLTGTFKDKLAKRLGIAYDQTEDLVSVLIEKKLIRYQGNKTHSLMFERKGERLLQFYLLEKDPRYQMTPTKLLLLKGFNEVGQSRQSDIELLKNRNYHNAWLGASQDEQAIVKALTNLSTAGYLNRKEPGFFEKIQNSRLGKPNQFSYRISRLGQVALEELGKPL